MNVPFIFNGKMLSFIFNGERHSAESSHPSWTAVVEAYKKRDWKKVISLLDVPKTLALYACGKVKVLDGAVLYDGKPVHGVLVDRILGFMREGLPYQPWVKFLNNSKGARDDLYLFLEAGQIPLTDDGCFLAYKKVRNDFRSFHCNPDGSYNVNKVGKTLKMKREECCADRNQTCASGLHFCSYDYLPQYEGDDCKVVTVKINPNNVVSIPNDYNNTKGRCCEYTIHSLVGNWRDGHVLKGGLYSSKIGKLVAFKRDRHGRFTGKKQRLSSTPKRNRLGQFVG